MFDHYNLISDKIVIIDGIKQLLIRAKIKKLM